MYITDRIITRTCGLFRRLEEKLKVEFLSKIYERKSIYCEQDYKRIRVMIYFKRGLCIETVQRKNLILVMRKKHE